MNRNKGERTSANQFLIAGFAVAVGTLVALEATSNVAFSQNRIPFNLVKTEVEAAEWEDRFDAQVSIPSTVRLREPMYSPNSDQFLTQGIEQYRLIVRGGGWPRVPATDKVLRLGVQNDAVALLRRRLQISGDLSTNLGRKDTFDSYVEEAVKKFQWRHGIIQNGILTDQTRAEMNVPAIVRLKQLEANLPRLSGLSSFKKKTYVMVNIPGAEIEAVENGLVHSRHTAVVGKIDRPTPLLRSSIHELNFNPYWTVPKSIIERDLIPVMNEDPEYLVKNKIRIFDWHGKEISPEDIDWKTDEAVQYLFKQDPGSENSLGSVKINFHNKYSVYLHDTPSKSLFGTDFRFHSSGCVRVQNVRGLITWLLDFKNADWDRRKIDEVIRTGERLDVGLKRKIPIVTTYVTAWANSTGTVHFRNDIYERDGDGSNVLSILSDG